MGALEALQGAVKVGQDGLSVGKWTSPGAQGAAGLVEPAPVPPARDRSLGAAAALIELTNSQEHDGEGVYDCPSLGKLLTGGALEPDENVHHHHLNEKSRRTPTNIGARIYAAPVREQYKIAT